MRKQTFILTTLGLVLLCGCTSSQKTEDRLLLLENTQVEDTAKQDQLREELAQVGEAIKAMNDQLGKLNDMMEKAAKHMRKMEERLAKAEQLVVGKLSNRPAASANATETDQVNEKARTLVARILTQHGDILELSEDQRKVLAREMQKSFVTILPLLQKVKSGELALEDVEDQVLATIDKLVEVLIEEGTLSNEQTSQIRIGLPDVLIQLSENM